MTIIPTYAIERKENNLWVFVEFIESIFSDEMAIAMTNGKLNAGILPIGEYRVRRTTAKEKADNTTYITNSSKYYH